MGKVYKRDGAWQFNYTMDGKQKQFYLGKRHNYMSASNVEKIVSELLECRYRNERPSPDLLQRLSSLDAKIRETIKRHGLECDCMYFIKLGELIDRHRLTKADKKPKTIERYEAWYLEMMSYFGSDKIVSEIAPGDADLFRVWCLTGRPRRFAVATLAKGVRMCRSVVQFGVKQGFFTVNPFDGCIVGADHNDERQYYVSRETIEKVLSVCRNDRLRFAVMLARYAGLRIPSEIRYMKFSDFGTDGFYVHHNTKTGRREVPFFKELRPVFERLKAGSRPDDLLFPVRSWREDKGVWLRLLTLIDHAGVARWPRLLNNLRSSCIMDYDEMGFSQKTLDSIFGNSEEVRRKHYIGFRRDREFMKMLNADISVVKLLSSLGGIFENGLSHGIDIDTIISRLSLLKTLPNCGALEIPICDKTGNE